MESSAKTVATLEQLEHEAEVLVSGLAPADQTATLVTLSGELGAGKTSFAQAAARALGIDEHVTSPTFVLAKVYGLPEGNGFARLVHIDAYRLTEKNGLATIGFGDLLGDPENLILLEWPEMVVEELPPPQVRITLEVLPDGTRTIAYA